MDRDVIVMKKDGIIHWSILNMSVVVSLFHFNAYPNDELPLIKESLLLR